VSKTIAACKVEAAVLSTWLNFLEDTWLLQQSHTEAKEKQLKYVYHYGLPCHISMASSFLCVGFVLSTIEKCILYLLTSLTSFLLVAYFPFKWWAGETRGLFCEVGYSSSIWVQGKLIFFLKNVYPQTELMAVTRSFLSRPLSHVLLWQPFFCVLM